MSEHRQKVRRCLHAIVCGCGALLVAGCAADKPIADSSQLSALSRQPTADSYQRSAVSLKLPTLPLASMRREPSTFNLQPSTPAALHGCAWDWNPTNSLAGKYWQVWASNDLANWRIVTNTLWPHYLAPATRPYEFYKVCTVDSLGRRGWAMKGQP